MQAPPFTVVIPARFGSSRLPGKPLAEIGGWPMILWVHDQAQLSGAEEVFVATDDARIVEVCDRAGVRVELTRSDHASGTDRIAELAHRFSWKADRIVINVQGDEPRLPPVLISQVADLLAAHADAAIATLVTPIESENELVDPNAVKVVTNQAGYALYFSRAPIPFERPQPGEEASVTTSDMAAAAGWRRHIGLYAYRVASLVRITAAPPCRLELTERLEQLRALWLGERIIVADALVRPPRGVDTPDDLAAVRAELERLPPR